MVIGRQEKIKGIREKARKQIMFLHQLITAQSDAEAVARHPYLFKSEDLGVTGLTLFNFEDSWGAWETGRYGISQVLPKFIRKYGATDTIFKIELSGEKKGERAWHFRAEGWIIWESVCITISYDSKVHFSNIGRDTWENVIKQVFRAVDEWRFKLKLSDFAHDLKKLGKFSSLEYLGGNS